MNAPPTSFALEMSRHFRAPRAKVFDAFVTEEALRIWKCPRGMRVAESSVDARVGGRWRIAMLARDSSRFVVGGQYREIVRPERLVFTWQWEGEHMPNVETLIEVSFTEREGGTRIDMRHSGFPAQAMCDAHAQGWRSTFNKLTDLLDERGTAASLVLLGDARSTYTRTARMGLAEKGVAYTQQNAAPHSPEILAVHPFGRIPAFKDGDIEIFETSAILRYVDECFDGPALLPATIMGRTRCDQWISAVNSYFYDTMVRRYLLQYIFPKGADGQPDRAVIDQALGEMPAQIAALDKAYAASDFLAGPTLSVADLFVAPIMAYLAAMPEGAQLLAAAPNLQRAQAAIAARPSFTTTQPQLS